MVRHGLTDEQWECIADDFPPPERTGRPRRSCRQILDGILWILQTGAPWRDLPSKFGPFQTVWHRYNQWVDNGTLERIVKRLQQSFAAAGLFSDELWCVDGTITRAARCSGGGGKKATRASPKTTPWAAPEAVSRRKSTLCAITTAIH